MEQLHQGILDYNLVKSFQPLQCERLKQYRVFYQDSSNEMNLKRFETD